MTSGVLTLKIWPSWLAPPFPSTGFIDRFFFFFFFFFLSSQCIFFFFFFFFSTDCPLILNAIWKRFDEPGKHWRHVYKALLLLEYLIKNGSEQVPSEAKVHLLQIKTLKDFQYIDEDRKDVGLSVRERAKKLAELIADDEAIKSERAKAAKNAGKYTGVSSDDYHGGGGGGGGGGGHRSHDDDNGDTENGSSPRRHALEDDDDDEEEKAKPKRKGTASKRKDTAGADSRPRAPSQGATTAAKPAAAPAPVSSSAALFDAFAPAPSAGAVDPFGGSAFGAPASAADPFGGSAFGAPAASPFGAPAASPFGAPAAASPFGAPAAAAFCARRRVAVWCARSRVAVWRTRSCVAVWRACGRNSVWRAGVWCRARRRRSAGSRPVWQLWWLPVGGAIGVGRQGPARRPDAVEDEESVGPGRLGQEGRVDDRRPQALSANGCDFDDGTGANDGSGADVGDGGRRGAGDGPDAAAATAAAAAAVHAAADDDAPAATAAVWRLFRLRNESAEEIVRRVRERERGKKARVCGARSWKLRCGEGCTMKRNSLMKILTSRRIWEVENDKQKKDLQKVSFCFWFFFRPLTTTKTQRAVTATVRAVRQ
jgi:hypothetical protein